MKDPVITGSTALQTPSLRRRFASLLYEVVVLFGVALVSGAVGALLLAITGRQQDGAGQIAAFFIFGAYFTWFWTRRGQTLPMQTWHIRLITASGAPLTSRRAMARYLAGYLWFAPGVMAAWAVGWNREQTLYAAGINVVVYGLLAWLHPDRQFIHDALCGTRLVDVRHERGPSTR